MAQDGEGRPGVKAKILPGNPTDDVHVLSYTLQRNGSDWQAIDVGMGGFVSFAAVKQTELRAVLWSKGALALRNRPQELATELADKPAPRTSGKIRRSISARTSYPPAAATAMCRGRCIRQGTNARGILNTTKIASQPLAARQTISGRSCDTPGYR